MINAILNFSVRQRMLVLIGVAILTGFGLFAVKRIPIDAFPDVTNVQVQVLATAGGMSPPEVEKLLTWPIEIQMGGLPRLEEIRSVSKIGLSAITIVFEDGVDDYFARQLVSERLRDVRGNLPAGVEVSLGPITTGLGEVFQYTLESKDKTKYDATELRTIQDYIVRPLLRTVPGVADVNSFGGLTKQYLVIIQPERLLSHGVSLAQVFEALEKNNSNASGNFIEHQSEQYVVRGLGLVQNFDDIRNIIVGAKNHAPIYVSDVAEVKVGAELRQGAVTMNGQGEVVAGIVMMLKGGSGRDVVNAVKAKLPDIQKALPSGVTLNPFYDRTDLVKKAIQTVTKALGEGAVFILIILIILLADLRSAIIVTLVLPLAVLFAFIMMKWFGLSANLMSLGGLAIGIGMMVDGAVVMVENIHRHLTEKGDDVRHARGDKIETVLYAAKEVGRPIVFGIFIIILVFLPLFTLQGFEGKMFSPLAFTISFALLGSLILSLTFVPMLCTFLLKQVPHEKDPFYIRWLKQSYAATLQPCVRHPWLVGLAALVALGGSFALVPRIGTEFLPPLDEGSIAVQTFRIPSISLTESLNLQTKAEKILKRFPEVVDVISKTGRADIVSDPMGVEISDVIVTLKSHEDWTTTKSKDELVEKMREALAELPGVASSFSQPIALRVDELVSGVKSAIGIKIFGEDLDVLKEKGDEVARVLSTVPGATDINAEKVSGLAYLQIEIDRARIARFGINVADIQDVIETAIGGK
ncbi:MAG: CusA/CzcA family heavy metal efflux RND transporter, partial [Chthoniobacterales bacterium]